MKLIEWFKKLRRIVANYDFDREALEDRIKCDRQQIAALENLIVDRTTVSADIAASLHDRSHVVLIGRYRNADYVEIVDLGEREFHEIVDHVRAIRGHGRGGRFDVPYGLRHVFERLSR